MKRKLYCAFVELTGNRFFSYILKSFASSSVSRLLNRSFVNFYHIDQVEMEKPLHEYRSLQQLFTRKLKAGLRPIAGGNNTFVSPVDGILATYGTVDSNISFRVKEQNYSLEEMLGSKEMAEKYEHGVYMIFYLSPSNYHRFHAPISGEVIKQWTLGNVSYPVNEHGLRLGKRPLSRNYRLISEMNFRNKRMAYVKVGALNVNSIHLTHKNNHLEKGEEVGYFAFGSTVILLFEENMIEVDQGLTSPTNVKVGEKIGEYKENKKS